MVLHSGTGLVVGTEHDYWFRGKFEPLFFYFGGLASLSVAQSPDKFGVS